MSNIVAFPARHLPPEDGWSDSQWLHTVGFGPLDGPFDTEPDNPRDALNCLFCEGWGEVGEVVAKDGEWTFERGPFVLCPACGGTGNGFEIGGSG